VNHFGPMIAADLRKRRPKPHTICHLDEVYLKIDGRLVYLWRAVDAEGEVLDVLVQTRGGQGCVQTLPIVSTRVRFYKGRDAQRTKEIEQIAARYGLPEILNAKDLKHAHALDKILNHISEPGFKPIRIISSPHLKNNSLRGPDGSLCNRDFF
jgi:hypothetical protein